MKSSRKNIIFFVIFWVILIASFIFFTTLIILKANGYQLNYKAWKIVRTGMILLNGEPRDVAIKVNAKILKNPFPVRLSNLHEGEYEITVSKDNYTTWQKIVSVSSGRAASYQNILLYFNSPIEIEPGNVVTVDKVTKESQNYAADLTISKTEIFYQGSLLTRFSQNVLGAWLTSDNQHVVFQVQKEDAQASEIRIMDIDSSNNQLLFTVASIEPIQLTFRANDTQIYYVLGGQVKAIKFR